MGYIRADINFKDFYGYEDFDFSIKKVAVEHCHPQKLPETRKRVIYSLHFITFGSGTLVDRNGKNHILNKGECFLIYKGENFKYYPKRDDPWSYMFVDFDAENIEILMNSCGLSRDVNFCHIENYDAFRQNFENMLEHFDGTKTQTIACSGFFIVMISLLLDNFQKHININPKSESKKFKLLREVLIYINNNYRLKMDTNTISAAVGLSPSYINAIFASEIQVSPIHYLNLYRIANACELIRENKLSIGDISLEVGYIDQLYFSRIFSKIKGISPRMYSKLKINENPYQFLVDKQIDFR